MQEKSLVGAIASSDNLTFTDYDSVHDLVEDTSGERHIRAQSPFSWVQVKHNQYILSNRNGDYLSLVRTGSMHEVFYYRKIQGSTKAPYMPQERIAISPTFEDAVRASDTYAKKKLYYDFISKNAPWRRSPASENQIAFLNKFREEGNKLAFGDVSKGRANDWITKIRNGAKGEFNRMKIEKARQEKRQEEQSRQGKAKVKVGPLSS